MLLNSLCFPQSLCPLSVFFQTLLLPLQFSLCFQNISDKDHALTKTQHPENGRFLRPSLLKDWAAVIGFPWSQLRPPHGGSESPDSRVSQHFRLLPRLPKILEFCCHVKAEPFANLTTRTPVRRLRNRSQFSEQWCFMETSCVVNVLLWLAFLGHSQCTLLLRLQQEQGWRGREALLLTLVELMYKLGRMQSFWKVFLSMGKCRKGTGLLLLVGT